jgi:hypothetical protein
MPQLGACVRCRRRQFPDKPVLGTEVALVLEPQAGNEASIEGRRLRAGPAPTYVPEVGPTCVKDPLPLPCEESYSACDVAAESDTTHWTAPATRSKQAGEFITETHRHLTDCGNEPTVAGATPQYERASQQTQQADHDTRRGRPARCYTSLGGRPRGCRPLAVRLSHRAH